MGALLTRQAGWQVVIAAYYVSVDVTLVAQFVWYTHIKKRGRWSVGEGGDLSHSRFQGNNNNNNNGRSESDVLEGVPVPDCDDSSSVSRERSTEASRGRSMPKDVNSAKGVDDDIFLNGQSPSYSNEKKQLSSSSSRRSVTSTRGPILPIAATRTVLLASMLCAVLANAAPTTDSPPQISPAEPQQQQSTLEIIGRIASWISTILYLGSRPPQLYKNYRRKSTSGLSPLLFMAAFCGNFFYSASLLTNPNAWSDFPPYGGGGWADDQGNSSGEWIGRTMPFFLGAAGVLGLDALMGVQFLMYGSDSEEEEVLVVVGDGKDCGGGGGCRRSRWMRVTGWMRGWIPSVSPERGSRSTSGSGSDEGQALLNHGREEGYGTV